MINILFITTSDFSGIGASHGGIYGSKIHVDLLKSLSYVRVTVLSSSRTINVNTSDIVLIPATRNRFDTFIGNLMGYAVGFTKKAEEIVFKHLDSNQYDILFLDTSNLGRIARRARTLYPSLKIITFFHNVEYIFMLSKVKVQGIHYIPLLFASWYNEKLATRYSNILIAITERDKKIIEKKYKTNVSGILLPWFDDYILPMNENICSVSEPLEVLFLGSVFHANVAGIKWFVEKVLPKANIRLTIAGRGMEVLRGFYPNHTKINIIGTVQDLKEIYDQADCIVAPIFDGSGIKIKTGEALRYGKTIVGTHEAFTGYHITHGLEGYICEKADDFVQAFKKIKSQQRTKTNMASYRYFKKYLSKDVALKNMESMLSQLL